MKPSRFGLPALTTAALVASAVLWRPKSDSFPPLTPFPPEESAVIRTIQGRTAAVRHLKSNPKIEQGTISREALQAWVSKASAEEEDADKQQVDRFTVAFRKLHMLSPTDDLSQLTGQFLGNDVLGLYFPGADRLVVIGDHPTLTLNDEFILSHEYVHSFQDKAFNQKKLDKLAKDESREYSTTIDCVTEGDAVVASIFYMNEIHGEGWYDQLATEETKGNETPDALAPAFERYADFNYNECVFFVAPVQAHDGWTGVDRLYETPPVSTEQILHPDKYFAHEFPTSMRASDLTKNLDGWKRVESFLFGEFDVYNYLYTVGGEQLLSAIAAAGWGNGWMNIYARPDSQSPEDMLLHLQLEWDTPADFDQFNVVYNTVLDKVPHANRSWAQDGSSWEWQGSGFTEFGAALWDRANKRVDILIAPDADSLSRARDALKPPAQSQVTR